MRALTPRSRVLPAVAIGIALVSFGCTPQPPAETPAPVAEATRTAPPPSADRVRDAALVSVAVEKEPGRVKAILDEHHMTPEQFDALMLDIAQDSASTEAFEAARAAAR